ncbi:hypothetical protein SANTM175S_04663 [Streptomyces antimycoticus]
MAALPPLFGESVNFSGTPLSASTAIRTDPIVESLSALGLISRSYASRPATREVPSTVTSVVSSTEASTVLAISWGVAPRRSLGSSCRWSPLAFASSGAVAW